MNDTVSTPQHSGQTASIGLVVDAPIATITLNNPAKLNALPQRLWEALPLRFKEAVQQGARVIVLTGAGDNFCAGADISEFDEVRRNAETAQRYERANEDAFAAVRDAPVPVIAQICGICFGGGFGLAAACDLRIASENSRFSVPAAKLGLAYPVAAMVDIVHAVGAQNAKRLLYLANRFSADQMREMGFISDIVPVAELAERVSTLAQQIAALAPLTHRATKASVAAALGGDIAEADRLGAATFASADYAEGRGAFREKRKPQFNGS